MNKKRGILGQLILAFGLWTAALTIGSVPMFQGCTATQKRITYNTLYSTHVAVDGSFSAYMAAVLAGAAPTNNVPRAGNAYRRFQTVFDGALRVAQWNTNAVATADVTAAATEVFNATTH